MRTFHNFSCSSYSDPFHHLLTSFFLCNTAWDPRIGRCCVCVFPFMAALLDGHFMASGKQRLINLSSSPWTATQRLVTRCGRRGIATPMDVLDVEKVPLRGIPDGRRGERIACASCWTRAVPAPNQDVNRTEWCCVRRECASSRCEQVKSHVGC